MTRLYIVRHGETDWNREKRTQGCSNDLPLSDTGKMQAASLAARFKGIDVDMLYSSDLIRASQTAEKISEVISREVNTLSGFREMNFGCWEGLTSDEIKNNYKDIYEVWSSRPKDAVIPGGETLIGLQKRVLDTVNEILFKHRGKNIVIVSHGITIKVLILSLLGFDLSCHRNLRIDNTGVSIVDVYDNRSVLTLYNDVCHL